MPQSSQPYEHLRSFSPQGAVGPMIVGVGATDDASVLRVAHALTPLATAGVIAATVVEPLSPMLFAGELGGVPVRLDDERADSQLAHLTERVRTLVGDDPAWECAVVIGDAARAITDLARSRNAPLLVLGLGRRRPLDRLLGVETTLRAVRQAPCPVLCVAHAAGATMRDIVVATDFSVRCARAAEAAMPLLARDATVHLLHVWNRGELSVEVDDAYVGALPARFRRFIASLSFPSHVKVTHASREGRPTEQILEYADRVRADLIVAGRHGRGVVASVLAGSVTSALLRGAQRSVLVAPEPAFADVDRLWRLLTGMSESSDPAEWLEQLDAFTRRNRGRTTVVEEYDRRLDAHVLERGYLLLGASYDDRDRQVELMLGGPRTDERSIIRHIPDVDFLTLTADPMGKDVGLSIQHARGKTVLRFDDESRQHHAP